MSEKMYEEAFNYAMNELHTEYKNEGKEDEFRIWFNMEYVEDSIDSITISVASAFLFQMISKKGYITVLENKLHEILGQNNLKLKCIVKPVSTNTSNSKTDSTSENDENSNDLDTNTSKINTQIEAQIDAQKKDYDENKSSDSEKENFDDLGENSENQTPQIKKNKKTHPQLRQEFVFENFIPGDNCMFAYNAALSVAKNPGTARNPILFYGGSGLGKTHLMQAIGNYIYNENPKAKICYVPAESFTNEFLESLKTKKTNEFKNKYRNLDVLLLDDIHFLQGKEQTQEELFYTFNALYDKKKQMVFTCDRPIRDTKDMADRLVSRLSNGLCIDIQAPKYEDRYAILQKKIELMGKQLDPEIIDYIAKNIETNVRDLEAALTTLISYSELVEKNLTLDLAKNQLKGIITNTVDNISLDTIEKVIADNYQITVSQLKSTKKDRKIVVPRQIAIYLARVLTEISYTELGREFDRDHSTIMHNFSKIEDDIKVDPTLDAKIQLFIKQIKEYKK